ncbi:sigma-70 family RNA polymerase sigma factor [Amantichitinum ursilacus]|uniref:Putative RNA polymerase sigma factor FecI n=1 Tax=Amantichitinum ursilacus TaxID=857265 RepID=A0A0N1JTF8_9NEIS|nr:sigma-70 family RNA polymerase sigma factor [Amantichitinum ursilacus]KPC54188.1 putative RNA polymerase sigma factor FecI [Amantichitinum ursilacus]
MAVEQDPTAQFSALYGEHHAWLAGWLRRKLGNAADAADLAHDTFVRVMAGRDLTSVIEPRAFLTTVAKGVLVNWYKRQALERAWLEALAQLPEAQMPSPEQRYVMLETLHALDAMLDALPPLVKRAFLLAQLEGRKYEAIAAELRVSLITVKRYIKQAYLQCLLLADDLPA